MGIKPLLNTDGTIEYTKLNRLGGTAPLSEMNYKKCYGCLHSSAHNVVITDDVVYVGPVGIANRRPAGLMVYCNITGHYTYLTACAKEL